MTHGLWACVCNIGGPICKGGLQQNGPQISAVHTHGLNFPGHSTDYNVCIIYHIHQWCDFKVFLKDICWQQTCRVEYFCDDSNVCIKILNNKKQHAFKIYLLLKLLNKSLLISLSP